MSKLMKCASSQHYDDEATLLRKVTEWLAPQCRDGIKVLRICDRYAKGYADLFICVRGIFVIAELKLAESYVAFTLVVPFVVAF